MNEINTLVIGGTSGIGKDIVKFLRSKKHHVITVSRKKVNSSQHLTFDILNDDILYLKKSLKKKINYLIFSQRYRGDDDNDHLIISLKWVSDFLEIMQDFFLKEASIVILGSIASDFFIKEQSAIYHASRGALKSLVKYYAVLLGKKGIRVNSISPDFVIKESNRIYLKKNPNLIKKFKRLIPLQKVCTSKDISYLINFLCSKQSTFLTGQNIILDGGLTAVSRY